jgi:diacylglycerol O-acyltransferase
VDHLSSLDASFLHLETPETPMHVGSLHVLELPEGFRGDFYEDVKAQLASRLHLAGVLHRKLASMPFELADPVWIEDEDIDIDYHVRRVMLPKPGTLAQLEAMAARLHSSLLDRSRPLWESYVIEGLQDGHVAYYSKVHHSGVDGKAGVELGNALFDTTPEPRIFDVPVRPKRGQYQLGMAEMLEASLRNAASQYANLAKMLPGAARALSKVAADGLRSAGRMLGGSGLKAAPKTIFNTSITNQRSFATLSIPLADLKQLAKRHEATLNDVLMAVCSTALRHFLEERSSLPSDSLVAAVPVSLREKGDKSMNNQVTAMLVNLATDVDDPAERLRAVRASSDEFKNFLNGIKGAISTNFPLMGSPWIMSGLATLYGRSTLSDRLPAWANVLISNVPGSPISLYLAGARMLNYFPVSIPYHGNALNITVQSYAGSLDFGLIACRRALPQSELHSLAKHLKRAFEELGGLKAKAETVELPADPVPTVGAASGKPKSSTPGKSGGGRRLNAEARGARRQPADTAQRNR